MKTERRIYERIKEMDLTPINVTLTWRGALKMLIVMMDDGTPESKEFALNELDRMARIADMYAEAHNDELV